MDHFEMAPRVRAKSKILQVTISGCSETYFTRLPDLISIGNVGKATHNPRWLGVIASAALTDKRRGAHCSLYKRIGAPHLPAVVSAKWGKNHAKGIARNGSGRIPNCLGIVVCAGVFRSLCPQSP